MRVDYFTNYAGSFLAVSARTSQGLPSGGATMAMAWKEAGGDYGTATNMSKYTDVSQYMYHRVLVRDRRGRREHPGPGYGEGRLEHRSLRRGAGEHLDGRRLASARRRLPEGVLYALHGPDRGERRLYSLAAEFPDLAEVIVLPYKTNGYQRQSMAVMAGTTADREPAGQRAAGRRGRALRKGVGPPRRQRHPGRVLDPGRRTRRLPCR